MAEADQQEIIDDAAELFEHAVFATSPVLLSFFSTRDANSLRLTSRLLLEVVTNAAWNDKATLIIVGEVQKWRACFPRALAANYGYGAPRASVYEGSLDTGLRSDDDFRYLREIQSLFMSWCSSITDNAFEYLHGIHTLDMTFCQQSTISDKAFKNLRGIHTLDMEGCVQTTITDKAFENLRGIHTLNMSYCNQSTITDKAFENLTGIHTLDMSWCNQTTITDKAFENLTGIHTLDMSWCNQPTIIDYSNAFENLRGIHILKIQGLRFTLKRALLVRLRGANTIIST